MNTLLSFLFDFYSNHGGLIVSALLAAAGWRLKKARIVLLVLAACMLFSQLQSYFVLEELEYIKNVSHVPNQF